MIIPFSKSTIANSGGKAANLKRLIDGGFAVPSGFVISAQVYRQATKDLDVETLLVHGPTRVRKAIEDLPLPPQLVTEVTSQLETLGLETPLAVRSSATAEDLPQASFAGQQDTYLGIVGLEALFDAVRHCWASLWTDRATSYREQQGFNHHDVSLAVIIQQLVDADSAGVMFTANPTSGLSEILINAAWGLGESVVSGAVTPDEYSVQGQSITTRHRGTKATRVDRLGSHTVTTSVPDNQQARYCLSDDQILELADVGKSIEEYFGKPMDVEWAYSGSKLWLLQARPITTLTSQSTDEDTGKVFPSTTVPKTTVNGRKVGKLSMLFRRDLIEHYPAPYPLDLLAVTRMQQTLQHCMETFGLTSTPVTQLLDIDHDGVITSRYPDVRLNRNIFKGFCRKIPPNQSWSRTESQYQAKLATLANFEPAKLSSADIRKQMDRLLDLVSEISRTRFLDYVGPGQILTGKLTLFLKLARYKDLSAYDLLGGLEYKTRQIDKDLHSLALQDEDSTDYQQAFQEFLEKHGARTMKMYLPFSNQSWKENPQHLQITIDSMRKTHNVKTLQDNYPQLKSEILKKLPWIMRGSFMRAIEQWRASHIAREASLYLIEETYIHTRRLANEIATRLTNRGAITSARDIKYLTFEEALSALETKQDPNSVLHLVQDRIKARPRAIASWWQDDNVTNTDIKGIPGSPGLATGTARIITSVDQFPELKPGDILVCQYTDPAWTPLFALAAGVVTDTGGKLSHAAIVAREYQIPAIMGTQNATHNLTSGQTITINGTTGTVSVIK